MADVLFLVGPALGHIGRSLLIARKLAAISAVRVTFACPVSQHDFHRDLLVPEFPVLELPGHKAASTGGVFADAVERHIDKLAPTLIICDLSPLPWLVLLRFPDVPTVYLTNVFLTRLGQARTVQDESWRRRGAYWNQERVRRGLEPLENARRLYEMDCVLLADPPSVIRLHSAMPDHFRPVGPCNWEPDGNLPDELKGKRRILLLSMGSTGRVHLPEAVVEGLARLIGTSTVVHIGTHKPGYRMPVSSYSGVPAGQLLQQASFVVAQGGAGSVYQALAAGVPVGCVPSHRNHFILGRLLERLSAGVLFDPRNADVTLHRLASSLSRLYHGAESIAAEVADTDSVGVAVVVIMEQFLVPPT